MLRTVSGALADVKDDQAGRPKVLMRERGPTVDPAIFLRTAVVDAERGGISEGLAGGAITNAPQQKMVESGLGAAQVEVHRNPSAAVA